MAQTAVGQNYMTLTDAAKIMDAKGGEIPFINALSQANAVIRCTPWKETNMAEGEAFSVETYAPLPSTRLANIGNKPTFGRATQMLETCSEIKDYLVIDKKVANRGSDGGRQRWIWSMQKIRMMGRKFAQLFFYGNPATVASDFLGLAPRYGGIADGRPCSQNILNAGGTNNTNCSIWVVGFGPLALHGIFPKGSKAGFEHYNRGEQVITNAPDGAGNFNAYQTVYIDEFEWAGGIALYDWRHVVRIANIDVPSLNTLQGDADLQYFLDEAIQRLPEETNEAPEPGVTLGAPVYWIFMNRTARRALMHQRKQTVTQGAGITWENVDGQIRYSYMGYPIGIVDQLTNAEANVV